MKIRTTTPADDNKYYLKKPTGWNPCILGNNKYGLRPAPKSVLPNCIGAAVGAFNECQQLESCKYLGNYKYAKDQLAHAKKQGLKTGSDPKPGAVMLWDNVPGGGYHMAIVTKTYSINKVQTWESGWNYRKGVSQLMTRTRPDNWNSNKRFLCFIYLPEDQEEQKDPEPERIHLVKSGDTLTKIAARYNTTITKIMKDNPIIKNRNLIKVGWKLKV